METITIINQVNALYHRISMMMVLFAMLLKPRAYLHGPTLRLGVNVYITKRCSEQNLQF